MQVVNIVEQVEVEFVVVRVVLREEVEVDLVKSKSLPLTWDQEDDTPTAEHVEQVHPSSVAEQDTQTVVRNSQNSSAAAVVGAAVVAVVAVVVEVSAAIVE